MKKRIFLLMCIIILCVLVFFIFNTKKINLKDIANQFNNCKMVEFYEKHNVNLRAYTNKNTLIIEVKYYEAEELNCNCIYTLNGRILSTTVKSQSEANIPKIVIDCIGQLHGYDEGDVSATIGYYKAYDEYTLEEDGFKVDFLSDGSEKYEIDIDKIAPLMDLSQIYFTEDYVEKDKDYITDGFSQTMNGNLVAHTFGYNDKIIIHIGERKNLTENVYKSLLSYLKVIFDSDDVINYFIKNYPNISEDKEFDGIRIEINPTTHEEFGDDFTFGYEGEYQFIRVKIDKSKVLEALNLKNTN